MAVTAFTSTAIIDATTIGKTVLTASSEGIAADAIGLGATDDVAFNSVDSVDGSFSGNLNSEVGGSQRVYNLGTEGDTDTEYLETSFDTNVAKIEPKKTGVGTLREVRLAAGNSSVQVKNGLTTVKAGGYNVFRGSGSGSSYFYGFNAGTIIDIGDDVFSAFSANCDLGSTAKRWANTYSVDGDFSGDVTMAGDVNFTNLPTSDPGVAGQLYVTTGGALKVSQ